MKWIIDKTYYFCKYNTLKLNKIFRCKMYSGFFISAGQKKNPIFRQGINLCKVAILKYEVGSLYVITKLIL